MSEQEQESLEPGRAGQYTYLAVRSFLFAFVMVLLAFIPLPVAIRWGGGVLGVAGLAGGIWLTVLAVRARRRYTRIAVRLMEEEDAEKSRATAEDDTKPD